MTCVCPTCGSPSFELPLDDLVAACTPKQSAMLRFVALGGRPSTSEIIAHVYGQDPDGGPLTADIAIRVMAHHIRKRIGPLGWSIDGTRGVGRWRLERVPA